MSSNNNRPIDQIISNLLDRIERIGGWVIMSYGAVYIMAIIFIGYTISQISENPIWKVVAGIIVLGILSYTPIVILKMLPKNNSQDANTNQRTGQQPAQKPSGPSWYDEPLKKLAGTLATVIALVIGFHLFIGGTSELGKNGGIINIFGSSLVGGDPVSVKEQRQQKSIEKTAQEKAEIEAKRKYDLLKIQEAEETKRLKILQQEETKRLKIQNQNNRYSPNSPSNYRQPSQGNNYYIDPNIPLQPAGQSLDIGPVYTAKDFGRDY